MITKLGFAERGRVWKPVDHDWPFYAWKDNHWRCYPVDPRQSPGVISVAATEQFRNEDRSVSRKDGFEEA